MVVVEHSTTSAQHRQARQALVDLEEARALLSSKRSPLELAEAAERPGPKGVSIWIDHVRRIQPHSEVLFLTLPSAIYIYIYNCIGFSIKQLQATHGFSIQSHVTPLDQGTQMNSVMVGVDPARALLGSLGVVGFCVTMPG